MSGDISSHISLRCGQVKRFALGYNEQPLADSWSAFASRLFNSSVQRGDLVLVLHWVTDDMKREKNIWLTVFSALCHHSDPSRDASRAGWKRAAVGLWTEKWFSEGFPLSQSEAGRYGARGRRSVRERGTMINTCIDCILIQDYISSLCYARVCRMAESNVSCLKYCDRLLLIGLLCKIQVRTPHVLKTRVIIL